MLKSPKGRLTDEGVAHMKRLRESGDNGKQMSYQKIAQEMGVCITTVYNVLTGRTHAV